MEYALREADDQDAPGRGLACLNPYSNGICSTSVSIPEAIAKSNES